MKWGAIAVAATLASSWVQAAEPSVQDQAKALLAKPPSAEALFRLKHDLGPERLAALRDAVTEVTAIRRGDGKLQRGCNRDSESLAGLIQMALVTDDEARWRSETKEAETALGKRSALRDAAIRRAEENARASGAAADSWRIELARHFAVDLFTRTSVPMQSPPGGWADGVSAPVGDYLNRVAISEVCAGDVVNTAWLKAEIARRGWPAISREGQNADRQAFGIVQHADLDPAWQTQILTMLADLAPKGETDPKSYAYLFDRVARAHGGLQRYGTQGHCVTAQEWRPFDDEPGDLDARRASVGLQTEAAYVANQKCFKADGA